MKRILFVLAVAMLCLGCGRYGRVITTDKTEEAILARPEPMSAKPVNTNAHASEKQGSTQAAVPQGGQKK